MDTGPQVAYMCKTSNEDYSTVTLGQHYLSNSCIGLQTLGIVTDNAISKICYDDANEDDFTGVHNTVDG